MILMFDVGLGCFLVCVCVCVCLCVCLCVSVCVCVCFFNGFYHGKHHQILTTIWESICLVPFFQASNKQSLFSKLFWSEIFIE